MSIKPTSFQKKIKNKVPSIPGSKPSLQNAQLLVSSGVPSLDHILGGGLPVGTIMLIEEDTYGSVSKLLMKYFLAEGILSSHSLIIASQDYNLKQFLQQLPAPVLSETSMDPPPAGLDEKMTIAWRYQNLRKVQSGPQFGHHYDLSRVMDRNLLDEADITCWSSQKAGGSALQDLLETVQRKVEVGQFDVTANPQHRNILRVAVGSLGTPLWLDRAGELAPFLYGLRALLRSAYAVCLVTLPAHLFQDVGLVRRCEHLCDSALRLELFTDSGCRTNPVFRDYNGLVHLLKLPAIGSFASHCPESFDLAFKLRRKKFLIEKLHLPPELDETVQREQDDVVAAGCGGTGRSKLLDF